jgi:hypothetical protein
VEDAYGNCNGSAFGESGSVETCPAAGVQAATVGNSAGGATLQALPNTAAAAPSAGVALASGAFLALLRMRRRRSRRSLIGD